MFKKHFKMRQPIKAAVRKILFSAALGFSVLRSMGQGFMSDFDSVKRFNLSVFNSL